MKRKGAAWAAAMGLALAASGAHAAEAAGRVGATCIPTAEAEALFLAIAPELLRTAGQTCAASLPADSLLRRPSAAFLAKYEAEAERSWPLAKEAILKIAGEDARGVMETEAAHPLVVSLMAPLLAGKIKASDCAAVDRVLGYLEPLPARNMSGLLVTIFELSQRDEKGKGEASGLNICPSTPG